MRQACASGCQQGRSAKGSCTDRHPATHFRVISQGYSHRWKRSYWILVRDRLRPRRVSAVGGSTETDTRLEPVATLTTCPYEEAIEDLLGFGERARVTGGGEDGSRSCDGALDSATGACLGEATAGSSGGIVRKSVEVDDRLDDDSLGSSLHAYAAASYGSGGGAEAWDGPGCGNTAAARVGSAALG